MPITALQGLTPELEKALQLALVPVASELRNAMLQKLMTLAPATEPEDESFRLRADALIEALLADLKTSLPEAVKTGLLAPADSQAQAYLEGLTQILLAARAPGTLITPASSRQHP